MAYMNAAFDLYHKVVCKECENFEWIFIDDLIAPIISMLNKKGYITLFSCSGHAELNNLYIFIGSNGDYDTIEGHNCPQAYIKFHEKVTIPINKLPKEWTYDSNSNAIYYYYNKDYEFNLVLEKNDYNYLAICRNCQIANVMKTLYESIITW